MGAVQQSQVEGKVAPLDPAQGGLVSFDLVFLVVVFGIEAAADLALVSGDDPYARLIGMAVETTFGHVPQTVRYALKELGGVGLVVHLVLPLPISPTTTILVSLVVTSATMRCLLNGPIVVLLETTHDGAVAKGAVVVVVVIVMRCAAFGSLLRLPRMAPPTSSSAGGGTTSRRRSNHLAALGATLQCQDATDGLVWRKQWWQWAQFERVSERRGRLARVEQQCFARGASAICESLPLHLFISLILHVPRPRHLMKR